ncbi:MAG TPA: methyltransferase domain-containing protein [Dehalococcoidales bacterium]|nr:methyltransferase domain-containing protein [Dehalococcoidales bacterium]
MSPDSGDYNEFVADFYDPVYNNLRRNDIQFFVDCGIAAAGKTLELGCGTGRVLIPTARAGCEITGLDLSPFMLQKCREKLEKEPEAVQARVKLVQADMTEFSLGEKFDLITIPFRPFQHLITVADQKACLACVHKHLSQKGHFILDVFHPSIPRLTDPKYLMEMDNEPPVNLPQGSVLRRTVRTAAFHLDEQYNEIELIHYVKHPDGREERLVHAFPMRYFFRYELEHLLTASGFKIVDFFGNYDRSPFTSESPEMIIIAQKS